MGGVPSDLFEVIVLPPRLICVLERPRFIATSSDSSQLPAKLGFHSQVRKYPAAAGRRSIKGVGWVGGGLG